MSLENPENPNFLKKKYDLHHCPEVESAAERTAKRTGEPVLQNPAARIQNYLDRFQEITERTDPRKRARGLQALKTVLHDTFVIKPDDVPPSYFNLQGEIALREGRRADLEQGGVTIQTTTQPNAQGEEIETRQFIFPPDLKAQAVTAVRNNQAHSLDKWIDYLASADAQYPDWATYWAFRSMLDMGKLQKEEDENGQTHARFATRVSAKRDPATGELANDPTVASFPPLNPRALALTIGVLRDKQREQAKPKRARQPVKNQSVKLSDAEFQHLLSTENFSRLYAQFLIEMPEYSAERLEEVRGAWATFPPGADPLTYQPTMVFEGHEYTGKPLVPSLEGYPLEWCTADPDTATTQLAGGAFHVYYSINHLNEPTIPRLAIRLEGDRIAEPPRGIAPDQNLDPYIAPVLTAKLKEFGHEGTAFMKRAADMQRLTTIDTNVKTGTDLTKADLIFLYELESPIEGFGYQRDPRIKELRRQRNPHEDAPTVLDCTPDQIAWSEAEVNENTKAYIGPLFPGIFTKLAHLDHLYTKFPEGRIRRGSVEIGTIPKKNIESELTQKNKQISSYARDLLHNPDFTTQEQSEQIDLIQLTVADLGFPNGATTEEIYQRADDFRLDLCPAEVGPHLRLGEDTEKQFGEYFFIGMKKITDSGNPRVFCLYRYANGPWLDADGARPDGWWDADRRFVFRLRK